jgi:predicted short-subunit dehydrogenase-like oxidoreductase (DUF2520 family)
MNSTDIRECRIIGAGRLGKALSIAMTEAGYNFVWIGSKEKSDAGKLAALIGCEKFGEGFGESAARPEIIIIAVPDGLISEVSSLGVSAGIITEATVVLHTSGALGSEALSECAKAGASVAAFHPCQTFTSKSNPSDVFKNIVFDMEGDDFACAIGETISRSLGAETICPGKEARLILHTATAILSNYTVALYGAAEGLLESAGIKHESALKILNPLLLSTAANIAGYGAASALTGPVSRGDLITVEKHLEALKDHDGLYGEIYSVLGKMALKIAREKNAEFDSEKLERVFERKKNL